MKGAKENKTEQNMVKLVNAEHVQKTWKIRKAYRFVVQGTLQRTQHHISYSRMIGHTFNSVNSDPVSMIFSLERIMIVLC